MKSAASVSAGRSIWNALSDRASNLSMATRIALVGAVCFMIVSGATMLFLADRISDALDKKAQEALEGRSQQLIDMLASYDESMRVSADRDARLLNALFSEKISLGLGSIKLADLDTPVLSAGLTVLNGNFATVDEFTRMSGGVATVFVRKGDEFIRISTSLKKENGARAFGTVLQHASPAYSRLLNGEEYLGKTRLFGRDFMTKYWPIFDDHKQVIGALFVGVDFSEGLVAVKKRIKALRIGDTGYVFAIDVAPGEKFGNLALHPTREGTNRLDSKDIHGKEYFREMAEHKNGFIKYSIIDQELGQTAPREKVVAYRYFPQWEWVVATGSFTDEFTRDAQVLLRIEALTVPVGLLLLSGLLYLGVRRLVSQPLREVVTVFQSIGQGNYRNVIGKGGQNEIGQLLNGLSAMQTKLDHDLTRERQSASEALRVKRALDSSSTKALIVDPEQRVLYLNQSLEELLSSRKTEMIRAKPGFNPGQVLGRPFGELPFGATDGAPMAAADWARTHRYDAACGGLSLRVLISPILAEDGGHAGSVVEVEDRTVLVAVEAEVDSIVRAASAGDFTKRLELEGKDGFYRQLSENINQLVETSQVGLGDVQRVLEGLAQGNLTESIQGEYRGLFGQLQSDANQTVAQLRSMVEQIRIAAKSMDAASSEITQGNRDLSRRTEEQAASLEATAASMEELTATVRQNAESARQANQLAITASEVAGKGGSVVGEVVITMESISDSSKKIAEIIGVIDSIAFQTNILALNAAVEAARAGEQGRGFAVVASEVRNLAQRSADAAKEIKALISNSVEKVHTGSRQVSLAGQTMQEIVTAAKRVTDIMSEISSASVEQSAGIDQVNNAIAQMDAATQQNAALVEEAAAAALSMHDQTSELTAAVAVFRVERQAVDSPAPRITQGPRRGRRAA